MQVEAEGPGLLMAAVPERASFHILSILSATAGALEAASVNGKLQPFAGETDLFIYPGYRFNSVDCLLTNFHLPQSSLLMLVAAFAGTQRILAAYRHAVAANYRFFSYGDSMLLMPRPSADGI